MAKKSTWTRNERHTVGRACWWCDDQRAAVRGETFSAKSRGATRGTASCDSEHSLNLRKQLYACTRAAGSYIE